ncbi:MAG TPA: TOBE domain-containing protein, partial [Steroidobacteraceae bacterium]|nr:TOBE domain-containing protein [Steroidobacteraceae bacterium]
GRMNGGTEVTLGIRPEHLKVVADGGLLRGEVLVVERLGGETFLHVKATTGDLLTVQADGDSPVNMHDTIGLQASPADCHLFDQGGLAIHRTTRHPLAGKKAPDASHSAG